MTHPRAAEVLQAIENGATSLRQVGEQVGITGEYARQILGKLDPAAEADARAAMLANQRLRHGITAWGETKLASEWQQDPRCSVTKDVINARRSKGWTAEEAISLPPGARHAPRLQVLPDEVANRLCWLCDSATRVRGHTPADAPSRQHAHMRDRMVRRLLEKGYTAQSMANATGYSIHAVEVWLGYTTRSTRYAPRP